MVGDINGDCKLSTYEMCLLNGNNQDVCDCVADGGSILVCAMEDCIGENQGDSENASSLVSISALNLSQLELSQFHNYLITQNQCSEEVQAFIIEAFEPLADYECAFLPIIPISEMIADYDSSLFGDYPDSSIQQDHTLIKQQYEQQLENNGALSAVNFLIDIYNMETFGSDSINVNYTISFSNNVNEGDGVTVGEFNPISGELIGCEIILENNLLTLADFGYVARAIRHELYHVLQNQFYGLNGISDAAMEFDAYFSSIYRFNNLPRVSEPNKIIQLVVWLESNWDIMPESEKLIRQDQYNIVSNMFPKICNDD